MKTRPLIDVAPPETYETARKIFAHRGRIFDLFDHSVQACRSKSHNQEFLEKCRKASADFWIYETDCTPIPTSASRINITRTEQRGPATDIRSASAGQLRYINRRARKANMAIADYVEDRRPLLHTEVTAEDTPVNYSIHALKRFWERNEDGVNHTNFSDISYVHLFKTNNISRLDRDPDQMQLRTDLMVPYSRGAFIGSAVLKPLRTLVWVNDQLQPAPVSHCKELIPAFNAITYVGESQLSRFQKMMYDAILAKDYQKYGDLANKDLLKTAVTF
jgi:hypothetical protein